MHRSLNRIPAIVLALVLLAACSSDGSGGADGGVTSAEAPAEAAAPDAYMEGLCAAIVSYQGDLEAESTSLQDEFSGGTPTPEETKDVLVSFLGTMSDRTQQLIDDVEALGTPDVENGEQVKTAFVGAFQQVVDLFDSAKSDVEKLSTDDPAALAEGFATAATKLQEAGADIGASFNDLSSEELDAAAQEAASCAGVI